MQIKEKLLFIVGIRREKNLLVIIFAHSVEQKWQLRIAHDVFWQIGNSFWLQIAVNMDVINRLKSFYGAKIRRIDEPLEHR